MPKGYYSHDESYPVIYMLDGQNLFEDSTSYVGEWHIDESMDSMFLEGIRPSIIVGIDNGQGLRMNEYNPYDMERFGKGEGKETMTFIVDQLKPLIDKEYRTLKQKEYTAIAGSSMGGLMSFYAISQYPETFSKAMVLSPSFWISKKVEELISNIDKEVKIYMSTGSEEGEEMVNLTRKMTHKLEARGLTEIQLNSKIIEGMGHNERLWTMEFPIAYEWFFKE